MLVAESFYGILGLNPLHCGAVVASNKKGKEANMAVHSLNPLHCGAVVASRERPPPRAEARGVLIPFIAGQWSLLIAIIATAALTAAS